MDVEKTWKAKQSNFKYFAINFGITALPVVNIIITGTYISSS